MLNMPSSSSSGNAANNMQRFEQSSRGAHSTLLQMASTIEYRINSSLNSAESKITRMGAKFKNAFSGIGGPGGANTVMAGPTFSTPQAGGPGGPAGPAGPGGTGPAAAGAPQGGGNTNVFRQPSPAQIAAAGVTAAAMAMPGTDDAFKAQLYTSRAAISLGGGGRVQAGMPGVLGGLSDMSGKNGAYDQTRDFLNKIAKAGLMKDPLDNMRMMATFAQGGIYGGSQQNMQQVAMGSAVLSNMTPGMGGEGAAQAVGAMNRGRSVNMLRAVGIRVRDENGMPRDPRAIIDDLWNKLESQKRRTGGSGSTLQDIKISLLPGNAIATMLDNLFGNDPYLRKMVEDGLLLKASTGGAQFAGMSGDRMKKLSQDAGLSTFAANMQGQRTAQASEFISTTAPAIADAKGRADQLMSYVSGFFTEMDKFTGLISALGATKGFFETLGSGGNGALSALTGFLVGNPLSRGIAGLFKAEGGDVDGKSPYIVGERGPELFVPKEDGYIVPNHDLKNYPFRGDGGWVFGKNTKLDEKSSNEDFAKAFLKKIGAPQSQDSIDALKIWQNHEGGHFKNSAKYNPLNTTLGGKYGSESMNHVGVKVYKSWEDGLNATIDTLTGKSADKRGYTDIIEALKAGKSKEDILAAINSSAWVTGKVGGSPYNFDGKTTPTTNSGWSGMTPGSSGDNSSGGASLEDAINKQVLKSFASQTKSQSFAQPASSANTYNMGGVTIKIDGGGNPQATAEALKQLLSSQNFSKQLGGQ
jgi:hypothetical protein